MILYLRLLLILHVLRVEILCKVCRVALLARMRHVLALPPVSWLLFISRLLVCRPNSFVRYLSDVKAAVVIEITSATFVQVIGTFKRIRRFVFNHLILGRCIIFLLDRFLLTSMCILRLDLLFLWNLVQQVLWEHPRRIWNVPLMNLASCWGSNSSIFIIFLGQICKVLLWWLRTLHLRQPL